MSGLTSVWVMILVFYLPSKNAQVGTGLGMPAEFDRESDCEYALHMTLKRQAPKADEDMRIVDGFCQEIYR